MGESETPGPEQGSSEQGTEKKWTPPPPLSAEQREAVKASRLAETEASIAATEDFMRTGEPTVVEREEPIPIQGDIVPVDQLTDGGKVNAMRRAGMSDDRISEELEKLRNQPPE